MNSVNADGCVTVGVAESPRHGGRGQCEQGDPPGRGGRSSEPGRSQLTAVWQQAPEEGLLEKETWLKRSQAQRKATGNSTGSGDKGWEWTLWGVS